MFGIGGPELVVIVLLLLIFVGPEKLPEVMRTVGGGMRDLRRAANLAQAEVKRGLDELSREVDEVSRDVQDAARTVVHDVHGIGQEWADQVERPAQGPGEPANGSAAGAEAETIEVVRRKATPAVASREAAPAVQAPRWPTPAPEDAPRLESAPPWLVATADVPPELPAAAAIARPRFNPPGVPAGALARDAVAVQAAPVPATAPATARAAEPSAEPAADLAAAAPTDQGIPTA